MGVRLWTLSETIMFSVHVEDATCGQCVQQWYVIWLQVDANQWQHYQKLEGKLEAAKRDMLVLTKAFIDHRAQAAATTLVSHDNSCTACCNAAAVAYLIYSNLLP